MNVVFKVYWNNPIEMVAEAGTQQLTFEVPLGAIISNPSGGGTVSYPSFTGNAAKVLTVNATEDDVEWTTAVTQVYVDQEIVDLNATLSTSISSKADVNYVDTQDELLQDQIDLKADAIAVNQALSTKADLINGVIPAAQLPSFVDDVLEYESWNQFPSVGEAGKIYVDTTENKTWRWSGSTYVTIGGGGVALGETAATAYRGDRGKAAYDHSISQGNPHNTTTSDIPEGNKLYFTDDRVRATALSGLNTASAVPVTSADNILQAAGKLQAQIDAQKVTWVKANTIGTVHPSIIADNDFIELARINGMLWIRGFFKNTNSIIYESQPVLLRINDPAYKILQRISSTLIMFRITALSPANLSTTIGFYAGLCIDASSASTSSQYFSILNTTLNPPSDFYYIPPTCLGELVIK